MESFVTRSEAETVARGEEFGAQLLPGDVVSLFGELGTGKTHFIQGVCRALGVREHVASPTFTIANEYSGWNNRIVHFDLYRIDSPDEIRDLGFDEYIDSDAISLIEWAEKARAHLPPHRYEVHMAWGEEEFSRMISIEEIGEGAS